MNAPAPSSGHHHRTISLKLIGVVVVIAVALTFVVAYQKERIVSMLSSGDKITAEFTRDYKLTSYLSLVKLAGVNVGEVTDIAKASDGGSLVTMRINPGIERQLGGEPSAAIRPTLVVGGVYNVELTPGARGGVFNGHIPISRTTVPVELDQVLSPINPSAQQGMRGTIQHFNDTLLQGGSDASRRFVEQTPPALRPTGDVLTAFRGTHPEQDLPHLVSGLEGFAAVFNRKQGQFGNIIDSLENTTAALNAERQPIASTLSTLPQTLRTTRVGMADLQGSLDRLTVTAPEFRDAAQEFDPTLGKLGPVLHRARPVVHDLKDVLDDAEPLVRRLVPLVRKGNGVLTDIRGPVLDRINGPIKHTVLSPWHGSGIYAGGGNDHLLYQEVAYLCVAFDQVWKFHDQNGALGRLMAGVSGNFLTGGGQFPRSLEEVLQDQGKRPLGPADSNQHRDRGLSGIDNTHPINGNIPKGGNPLLLPLQGGSR